jgi:hypothetical protein
MFLLLVVVVSLAIPAGAAERHMMEPLVPADKLAATQGLTSPLPSSPKIVEQGQALYNGKGACFNCHGKDGGGDRHLSELFLVLRHHMFGAIARKAKSSG